MTYKNISRFYAAFLTSSIFFYIYYLQLVGVSGFLSYLIPALITTIVFFFYFIAGIKLFSDPYDKLNITLANISLIAQAFQLDVLGFKFKNYYGPYLGIGFSDTPEFGFIVKFRLFDFLTGNGFEFQNSILFMMNLFALALLLHFNYFVRKFGETERKLSLKEQYSNE